jgi:flagellar protein FlgJ
MGIPKIVVMSISAGFDDAAGSPPTLRDAAGEFESLFIGQLLQSMRRTVPQSGLLGAGSGEHLFREMLDQQWARQIATAGHLALGDSLIRQLAPVGADGEPPPAGLVLGDVRLRPETGQDDASRSAGPQTLSQP